MRAIYESLSESDGSLGIQISTSGPPGTLVHSADGTTEEVMIYASTTQPIEQGKYIRVMYRIGSSESGYQDEGLVILENGKRTRIIENLIISGFTEIYMRIDASSTETGVPVFITGKVYRHLTQ